MPVAEALELEGKLTALGIRPQQILCNQVYPAHFPPAAPVTRVLEALAGEPALASPLAELTQHALLSRDRRALHERYLAELRRRANTPVGELPMLFAPALASAHIHALAEQLSSMIGSAHREQRLAVNLEAVHAVLGLDVDHLAARLAEDSLHRRRDHAVAVRIAEDHHSATDVRVRDQVAGVDPPTRSSRALRPELTNLACRDADHGAAYLIV
jgi:hypothetical protein